MLKFKLLVMIAISAMLIVYVAGCSDSKQPKNNNENSAEKGKKVEVVVWGLDPMAIGSGNKEMIDEFNKAHPSIKLVTQAMPGSSGYDTQDLSKLTAAIAAGSPPDVVNLNGPFIMEVASRGILMPLNDMIKSSGLNLSKFYDYTVKEMSFKGQVWGLPAGMDDRVLYYNKDMFKQAGLDPDKPPRTWDELLDYSKKLTIASGDSFKQIGFIPNFGNSWFYLYAIQNNGKFLDDEGKKVLLNSPENVEALDFMVKGYDILGGAQKLNAYSSSFQSGANDPFLSGKVAMVINGNWALTDLLRFSPDLNFGVAMPPTPTGSNFKTWSGGWAWGVPKGAKHPQEAFEVVKWLTTEGPKYQAEAAAKYNASQNRTYIPSWTANIDLNEYLNKTYIEPLKNANVKNAIDFTVKAMEKSNSLPVSPVGQLLWSEHARAIDEAIYHKGNTKDILDAATKKVQAELDKFWSSNTTLSN
ncbi:ABC transporter substrate-binding protein [Paenibacillus aceris]|uniref:Multiple sugar transport system permease protein n=1 Tax=Paenibacillus aceris TaxID=869555 RepID=A0ABS4I201_9BACL|nr:ABC transporter substrate-binding protein [Paenibacillus aceris]MBP1964938.1 multiple sugar transport system permease protein [Paenibacillus aceris]NHW35599.1 ABC transporter substrate-binding protein [Paenibacillus aceris]